MILVRFNPSLAVLIAFDRELADPTPKHPLAFFAATGPPPAPIGATPRSTVPPAF